MKYLKPDLKIVSVYPKRVVLTSLAGPSNGTASAFAIDDTYDEME